MNGFYDEDYYERGIETGKSAYQNYRWQPELTIPMAMTLVDYLGLTRDDMILDYGCAKGFLVKALRLLHRKAYGIDISDYAFSEIDLDTKQFCAKTLDSFFLGFDWIIAKDVFEHIEEEKLKNLLNELNTKQMFVCVPLGRNGKYYSPVNDLDKSHIICETEDWWSMLFKETNWEIEKFTFRINGIKDNYYKTVPNAHGFFTLKRVLC